MGVEERRQIFAKAVKRKAQYPKLHALVHLHRIWTEELNTSGIDIRSCEVEYRNEASKLEVLGRKRISNWGQLAILTKLANKETEIEIEIMIPITPAEIFVGV